MPRHIKNSGYCLISTLGVVALLPTKTRQRNCEKWGQENRSDIL